MRIEPFTHGDQLFLGFAFQPRLLRGCHGIAQGATVVSQHLLRVTDTTLQARPGSRETLASRTSSSYVS